MNHHLIPTFVLFISVVALAVFGVLCLAKPDKLADYARRRHLRSSRFMQKWPFASMIMAPWIPTYLRFMGLLLLAFAVTLFFLGFFVVSQ